MSTGSAGDSVTGVTKESIAFGEPYRLRPAGSTLCPPLFQRAGRHLVGAAEQSHIPADLQDGIARTAAMMDGSS